MAAAFSQLSRSIDGKVAVITGAGSGIGRATARLLAEQGAQVAATDIGAESLGETVKPLVEAGLRVKGWPLDVTDLKAIDATMADIAGHFGGIDILINNAGIALPVAIDDDNYEAVWQQSLAVLLTSHSRSIRAALPWLRQSPSARIVNTASSEGLGATRLQSPYTAAKTGVIGLTRALAVELGGENITVNCVCPGPINTGMTAAIPQQNKALFAKRRVALRRYGEPEEVAHAILSLVLPAAAFITGVALPVDGGLTIRNA